jgi:hypothetical protein
MCAEDKAIANIVYETDGLLPGADTRTARSPVYPISPSLYLREAVRFQETSQRNKREYAGRVPVYFFIS